MKEEERFAFTGIGTSWCILVDGTELREDVRSHILDYVRVFNERFSRFLNDSEACAFKKATAGGYQISEEFAALLARADELRTLTHGLYDPAVGGLLDQAGYDAAYTMVPRPGVAEFVLPEWEIRGRTLSIDGPAVFDLGGMGKGYCIDRIAEILSGHGYPYYLVDGGGDMYGTSKQSGEPWRVALEYPGKPDTAAGMVLLKNEGIAVSDTFRRRWGGWHHIVHPFSRLPVEEVLGVAAVAPTAWDADCATSALFFTDACEYAAVGKSLNAKYLVFRSDGATAVSADWDGELFL
ncbi:MAG: FAD:protein FMN transferase [bacterium]|nr:FAD:protein FMN transferase [bacterium]